MAQKVAAERLISHLDVSKIHRRTLVVVPASIAAAAPANPSGEGWKRLTWGRERHWHTEILTKKE